MENRRLTERCVIDATFYYKSKHTIAYHDQTEIRTIKVLKHLDKSILDLYRKNLDKTEIDEDFY